MVGFAHSLHIQSDLNPKINLYPLDDMRTVYVRLRFLLTFAKRGVFDVLVVKSEFQYALKMKISRVPDLGQGKNE